ncbi:hypothetical protein [Streptomyces sp. NPDC058280]|uniref:hypothetical protein n=1 Tax=Streptomyces sp. NPDC058280 TaxID=3346419 RepID=UPI0036E67BCD
MSKYLGAHEDDGTMPEENFTPGISSMTAALLTEPPISRAEALAAAREHVEAMSTNSRGYQDGVKLADKVAAVESFARFLMGEDA